MKEIDKIKELTGNEYRTYKYLEALAHNNIVTNTKREDLEASLTLSYVTMQNTLKGLKEKGYIEYNGHKRVYKLLK